VSISEGGLTPEIAVERTPQQYIDGVDPQLEAALRFLKGETMTSQATTTAAATR
jgi:hypothetical protein